MSVAWFIHGGQCIPPIEDSLHSFTFNFISIFFIYIQRVSISSFFLHRLSISMTYDLPTNCRFLQDSRNRQSEICLNPKYLDWTSVTLCTYLLKLVVRWHYLCENNFLVVLPMANKNDKNKKPFILVTFS